VLEHRIPHKGALGFWKLEPSALFKVREQFKQLRDSNASL
jgi:hypothetical protein